MHRRRQHHHYPPSRALSGLAPPIKPPPPPLLPAKPTSKGENTKLRGRGSGGEREKGGTDARHHLQQSRREPKGRWVSVGEGTGLGDPRRQSKRDRALEIVEWPSSLENLEEDDGGHSTDKTWRISRCSALWWLSQGL